MNTAHALAVQTHGCKRQELQTPYFLALFIPYVRGGALMVPAVVDDFGSLVIVGGPL